LLGARWTSDGRVGWLEDDDRVVAVRLVEDWYEPGERQPVRAWVVEFMHESNAAMQQALIELHGKPAADEVRRAELSNLGHAVASAGPPKNPSGFGVATTGMANRQELRDRMELTSYALQAADRRLDDAARGTDEHAGKQVAIALTDRFTPELLGIRLRLGHPQTSFPARQTAQPSGVHETVRMSAAFRSGSDLP
jgi:hypothetical protein